MAGINPYSLNPNQMSNQMMNGMTSPQNVMPKSDNPLAPSLTSSYSTLQNQQAIQNNGQAIGNTGGLIASQMRSSASPVAPAVQMKGQSGMQMQPQKGLQPGQASANAAPKMTVY